MSISCQKSVVLSFDISSFPIFQVIQNSTRVVRNTTYLYVKMVVSMLISLYTARVFLNVLGASDYGLYTLIAGVIFMLGFFQDMLTRATLRYLCFYKANEDLLNQRKVYSISMMFHIGIAIIIALNLILLMDFLFSGFLNIDVDRVQTARKVYYFMIASFVFTVMTVPYDSVLNANEDMLYYSIVGIIESVLKLALALYLPYANIDKLFFFSLVTAIITVLSLIVKRIYCHLKYSECKVKWAYFDKIIARNMVTYAGWNFLTSISSLVAFNAMPVVLNIFFGTIANAAQGIASQINGVMTSFSTNIQKALSPVITKTGSGRTDIDTMKQFALSGSKISFLILAFLSVPVIIECPFILKVWLVNVPQWAAIFSVLLLIRTITNQLVSVYADCVYASENIKNYCIIKSVLNILPVILVYMLFKYGAAPYMLYVALFLCWELMGGIVVIYYNRRLYGQDIKAYFHHLLLPCMTVLTMCIALGYAVDTVLSESLYRLLLNIIISSLTIAVLSWKMVLDDKEKSMIIGVYTKMSSRVK